MPLRDDTTPTGIAAAIIYVAFIASATCLLVTAVAVLVARVVTA